LDRHRIASWSIRLPTVPPVLSVLELTLSLSVLALSVLALSVLALSVLALSWLALSVLALSVLALSVLCCRLLDPTRTSTERE